MTATSRSGGPRQGGNDHTIEDGGPIRPSMPSEIAKFYDELISQLPGHALRRIDVHELRLLAELLNMAAKLSEVVRLEPNDHKAGRLYLNVVDRIHRLSAAFGLNPMDRKRMSLPAPEGPDEFQNWLQSRGAEHE